MTRPDSGKEVSGTMISARLVSPSHPVTGFGRVASLHIQPMNVTVVAAVQKIIKAVSIGSPFPQRAPLRADTRFQVKEAETDFALHSRTEQVRTPPADREPTISKDMKRDHLDIPLPIGVVAASR